MSTAGTRRHYRLHRNHIPDLIYRLSRAMVSGDDKHWVEVELHEFDDGDVNVIVNDLTAATLKEEW